MLRPSDLLRLLAGTLVIAGLVASPGSGRLHSLFSATAVAAPTSGFRVDRMNLEAPVLQFVDADGKERSLAELRGKPVLLHFWASWCTPCSRELPEYRRATEGYARAGWQILTISVDEPTQRDASRAFLSRVSPETPYRSVVNAGAAHAYWAWGLPMTYVITADGKIRARLDGPREWGKISAEELAAIGIP